MVRIERENTTRLFKTFVSDQLTKEDYFKILPALQHTVNEWEEVHWYFEMRDFSGWERIASLEELRFDIEHANAVVKVAIVGEKKWQEWLTNAMSLFPTAEVRYFDVQEKETALQWARY